MKYLPIDKAEEFIATALQANQVPAADAKRVAQLMIQSDMVGADGHGIFRLPAYIKRIRAGGINLNPNIRIEREQGATALINGDNALGHLVMNRAVEVAIEKVKQHSVCWVGSHFGNHSGAASVYVRKLAEQGYIGIYMAVGNANHMAPWGGIDLLLSTNPIAIAVPAGDHPTVLLDIATTVAAYGKVKVAAQKGESIPDTWMIDKKGQPITDPQKSSEGSLLPIGGYKGYGLAVMIGLLAGTLNNAAVGKDTIDFNAHHDLITNTGQTIIAVDPNAFGDREQFVQRVITLVNDLKASSKLPGVNQIRVPGDGAAKVMAERSKQGIPISPELKEALNQCAKECGISVLDL
ncbi:Ldh family oxidoreductase [Polynucleobacter sp. MWH-Aus1W21]|jgi:LDH2 family malate/lactate/ureidoglycolate dehydrogenase|uniref:Ldh family oxidoreductase n=1 Tax=Polynucleobacter sp. MWH-Aus1W21 TaxID=1855880 RepID=UPI001BFEDA8C|nr:Ldh family oxidoreductase [Polynucleobacter sp. MWH-Aus1W21]QWD65296.1 Ldh family oxidoreductase [Polynucleobacter sp. MWH-Aus1W21]